MTKKVLVKIRAVLSNINLFSLQKKFINVPLVLVKRVGNVILG